MVENLSPPRARAIARGAAVHLAGLVGADGRFRYSYILTEPATNHDGIYSKARHLGALWAMLDWEHEAGWSPLLADAIERAAGYAVSVIVPFGSSGDLCVLDEGVIKVGGVALAVGTSLALHHRSAEPAHLDRALRLGHYVARQRRADGDFTHIVIPGPIARQHPTRSDMLTGQAVLSLALLGTASGDGHWLALALDSAKRLAAQDHGVASRSHWMLYALEALHAAHPEPWLFDYAQRIAAALVAAQWSAAAQSTPIACATEGLLAFARMSPPGAPARAEALKAVRHNLRHQLKFHHHGAFVRSLDMAEVRIDYIMHNVMRLSGLRPARGEPTRLGLAG